MEVPGELAAWGWLGLRLGGVLAAQVLWARVLGGIWLAVAGGLAVTLAGAVALALGPASPVSVERWLGGAAVEALTGAAIGLVVALPGHALLGAAAASRAAFGLARRGAVDGLVIAVVAALCVALGEHRPLLLALAGVASAWPAGTPPPFAAPSAATVAAWAEGLLALALALATPVLLVHAALDLTLRLVERAGGEVVGALRPWVVSAAAIVALTASWESGAEAWTRAAGPPWGAAREIE